MVGKVRVETGVVENCYLCGPDEDLVFVTAGHSVALSGLGPVVRGYSVVATRGHVRSAADAHIKGANDFIAFTLRVRSVLQAVFGGECLVTEHGRVPVCDDVFGLGSSDSHCFHAHFLMFPGAPPVEDRAKSHFAAVVECSSLVEALEAAAGFEEYLLLSPDTQRFLVMTRPHQIPRQLARTLVAEALGRPELARWYRHPLRDQAAQAASELRPLFSGAAE